MATDNQLLDANFLIDFEFAKPKCEHKSVIQTHYGITCRECGSVIDDDVLDMYIEITTEKYKERKTKLSKHGWHILDLKEQYNTSPGKHTFDEKNWVLELKSLLYKMQLESLYYRVQYVFSKYLLRDEFRKLQMKYRFAIGIYFVAKQNNIAIAISDFEEWYDLKQDTYNHYLEVLCRLTNYKMMNSVQRDSINYALNFCKMLNISEYYPIVLRVISQIISIGAFTSKVIAATSVLLVYYNRNYYQKRNKPSVSNICNNIFKLRSNTPVFDLIKHYSVKVLHKKVKTTWDVFNIDWTLD